MLCSGIILFAFDYTGTRGIWRDGGGGGGGRWGDPVAGIGEALEWMYMGECMCS